MITSEQFQEWKNHPVTKEIFAKLNEAKQTIIDQLAEGNTIGYNAEETHGLTSKIVGQINGLNQLLNISFEDSDVESTVDERSGY